MCIRDSTETELKERKHRLEDAISATKAAVEEGIVPGGGTAYLNALPALDRVLEQGKDTLDADQRTGVSLLRRALEEPVRRIAANAGQEGSVVVQAVKAAEKGIGYDAQNGEYVNMVEKGIIDPLKVTRSALENAASIAALVLTTQSLITDIPEAPAPMAAPPPEY